GRYVCKARRPECHRCAIADLCAYPDKQGAEATHPSPPAPPRARRGAPNRVLP
ncbi:MAG: hypothetical protein OSW77_01985, partial [Proteobacteria bacterium]|nr:hypothetical protein [Pseudomonadota bacterium]